MLMLSSYPTMTPRHRAVTPLFRASSTRLQYSLLVFKILPKHRQQRL
ncbi:hypothetical protein PI124_g24768 [Phytophthora idaei]|nr:hypothetical protein PI125_g26913 [Phytophthora idaei]KAG3124196.1 hypothetical protein PI126_g23358 [Phytophthora idaei]KAG3230133.1 hypothetical protein PI124_g24768 [Phytophthora idaei]